MMQKLLRHEFGIFFWMHVAVIVFSIASPILFHLRLIVAASILFLIQGMLIGGCILTRLQFGDRPDVKGFYAYYLQKAGFAIDPRTANFYVDRIQPTLILVGAVVWQSVLGFQPMLFR